MSASTYYELLGVARSATVEEIRAAYRSAARLQHPDSGGSEDRMRRLNEAWHVLQDPARRSDYDRSLAGPMSSASGNPAEGARPAGPPRDDMGTGGAGTGDLDDDLDDDLVDVWPPPGTLQAVEGWWALLPPGALLLAVGLLSSAFLFGSPALLIFAGGAFFLAFGLFVLVPLRAMLRSSSSRERYRE